MKAAIVTQAGTVPVYGDIAEPLRVANGPLIHVTAASISHVTKSRASGTHYSASGAFPFVPGIDGVGRLDDGTRVYFVLPRAPNGAMAERTVVRSSQIVPVPDALDDITAAAIANPGMSSWAALVERAHLRAGETVLVNGATGTAGRLAVQIAKHLGAGKVIATGRNTDVLNTLGADVTIAIGDALDAFEEALEAQFRDGIDVVIDYLWGRSAERVLIAGAKAGADGVPIRFVQIGSSSGQNITLPSAVLRSSAIELKGSGVGSVPVERLVEIVGELFRAAAANGFRVATRTAPLSSVTEAWNFDDRSARTVLTI